MGNGATRLQGHGEAMRVISTTATAALHEVLLQAALRAERAIADRSADERAREMARRMDKREAER